ncbi:unnamed protein product [Calypogeia fissa]
MDGTNFVISPILVVILSLVPFIFSLLFLKSRSNSRLARKLPLPPGDEGWTIPVIGDTPAFLKNPFQFLDEKREKYGGVFRTSLFGQTSVVLSTPESARFVLVQAQKSFKHGYRPSITRITDPADCFTHPELNSRVRKLIAAALGPENVHRHIPAYDALVLSVIDNWTDGSTINSVTEMETMTLKCFLHLLWGQADQQQEYMEVRRLHTAMNKGCLAPVPINLPFTAYGKALKASGEFQQILTGRIAEARDARSRSKVHDVITALIHAETEDGLKLTDEQIRSVVTTLVFAGYRTTATTLVWVFKFLHDNPEVLSEVKEEQMAIKNYGNQSGLTWDDMKKMTLTMKVLKETMRLAPILKFMSRMSLEEVECSGYVIPKGWRTYVSYHFHLDPKLYPDPLKFDPYRFIEPPKPNTFIPFGNGGRLCVGYEFANTVIPLVIHQVVTSVSFQRDGVDGVLFWPSYVPKDGYPLKIKRLNS